MSFNGGVTDKLSFTGIKVMDECGSSNDLIGLVDGATTIVDCNRVDTLWLPLFL